MTLTMIGWEALLAGRRARAVELNGSYWSEAVRYCQAAERKVDTPSLFDMLEMSA